MRQYKGMIFFPACYPAPVCLTFLPSPPPHTGLCQVRLCLRSRSRSMPWCFKGSVEFFYGLRQMGQICSVRCSPNLPALSCFPTFSVFPICPEIYDMFASFFCCFTLGRSNKPEICIGMRRAFCCCSLHSQAI